MDVSNAELLILKQKKGTRLASFSEENYSIIWTFGENYVLYPERKLIGFKSKLNSIMDIVYSFHLLCQSDTYLQVINYHDNIIAYSFDFKYQLIDFLYVRKYEKFATICQGDIISYAVQKLIIIYKELCYQLIVNFIDVLMDQSNFLMFLKISQLMNINTRNANSQIEQTFLLVAFAESRKQIKAIKIQEDQYI
ncbi:unnamed protein product [Paramecium pentaurelia]|uniref:Uncharacterized protein n=1 Tax=Paramecium pentaurelia TaxID=43138 RepID=A0A8S1S320_9CILI|nr:unnamed protein product [Paramecium pentaurelia]